MCIDLRWCGARSLTLRRNAVAIGFIFEVDDAWYCTLVPAHKKEIYQARPKRAGEPQGVQGLTKLARRYSNVLMVVSTVLALVAYLQEALPFESGHGYATYHRILLLICLRAGVFALAYLHMNVVLASPSHDEPDNEQVRTRTLTSIDRASQSANKQTHRAAAADAPYWRPRLLYGFKLVLSMGVTISCAFAAHVLVFLHLDANLGFFAFTVFAPEWSMDLVDDARATQWGRCVLSFDPLPECVDPPRWGLSLALPFTLPFNPFEGLPPVPWYVYGMYSKSLCLGSRIRMHAKCQMWNMHEGAQPLKAPWPMEVRVSGRVTAVREEQPLNAPWPMEVRHSPA